MIRTLKLLGLAVVAACALSAVGASGASAATFHCAVEPCLLTGDNTGHAEHVFQSGETQVRCKKAHFAGTATEVTQTTISVRPTYSECSFLGEAAVVDTTECTYIFHSHTNGTGHLPTTVSCTGTNAIRVTTGACNLSFGNQTVGNGTTVTDLATDVTVHATATATFTKSGPLCFLVAGNIGTYTGTATLKGFGDQDPAIPPTDFHKDGYKVTEGAEVEISWG